MRRLCLLATLGLSIFACQAVAQDPYTGPYISPAYRHFLTSPYSFRTYSNLGSGQSWGYDTPLESGRFYASPGYYHEEISPASRWSYTAPRQVQGYVEHRPVIIYTPAPAPVYVYPPPP